MMRAANLLGICVFSLAAIAVAASCGGSAAMCVPGQQIGCACAGGSEGTQVCTADGKNYGTCQCSGATSSSSSTSGSTSSGSSSGCAAPMTTCGGQCVDTSSDAAHCGSCGHGCQGGTCVAGACQPVVIASGQSGPGPIAVDATSVYWATAAQGSAPGDAPAAIVKAPLAGGTPTVLTTTQADSPTALAVDATSVYWVTLNGLAGKAALSGNSPCYWSLAQPKTVAGRYAIAVDATSVYWTSSDDTSMLVLKAALDCASTPTTLATQMPPLYGYRGVTTLALGATNVFWALQDSGLGTVRQLGQLFTVPSTGGTVTSFSSDSELPLGIAVDATNVYWVQEYNRALGPGSGLVQKQAQSGTGLITLADNQPNPAGIAVDATDVYWTNNAVVLPTTPTSPGSVMKCAIGGCDDKPTVLATGLASAFQIAVDAKSVYWTDPTGGNVMKLAK